MKKFFRPSYRAFLCIFVIVLAFFLTHWMGDSGVFKPAPVEAKVTLESIVSQDDPPLFSKANPNVRAVMAVQGRHTNVLMAEPGIVGTATGVGRNGKPAIFVLAKSFELAKKSVIPANIEGVPVIVKITGEILALPKPPWAGGGNGGEEDAVNCARDGECDRPVPIGISTGHPNITAGTIGCRVIDNLGNVYALSNNHVYADENSASTDENVLQPGPYDGGIDSEHAIGTLAAFVPIDFSGGNNFIDAAIALSNTNDLGNATLSDGYGTPKSVTAEAVINQSVMKYGRTTGQTKGRVWAINATVDVGYDSGVARFVNQIIITPGNFSAGGDSGSLIVIQKGKDARKPIGLLFAGSSSITVANPIDAVLEAFAVTIDGE
jgi:hypothetical protein